MIIIEQNLYSTLSMIESEDLSKLFLMFIWISNHFQTKLTKNYSRNSPGSLLKIKTPPVVSNLLYLLSPLLSLSLSFLFIFLLLLLLIFLKERSYF